ncbi:MAG: DMT family transporter [Syntrophothermus sp.]
MENKFKVAALYILVCLIWGTTWFAIRISLNDLTPFLSAGIRFIVASVIIYIIMLIKGYKLQLDKIAVRLYLVMGFFSFMIPFGLVYWGEQFVPSGLAAVLFGVYPFFIALFSYFFLKSDKIGLFKILGMLLGFGGIVIIFSDQFQGDLSIYFWGMLAIVLSGFMQAVVAVGVKKYGHHINPLTINFIPMAITGIFMTPIALLIEDTSHLNFSQEAILSILFLALFGSVISFSSYYWLLKRINIVVLSIVAFITPIIALMVGWIFNNEILYFNHILGSIFVLLGLLTANIGTMKFSFKRA